MCDLITALWAKNTLKQRKIQLTENTNITIDNTPQVLDQTRMIGLLELDVTHPIQ
jgi:hypothetical protein